MLAERVNLRYFLSLGMIFSGIFTFLFGLAKYVDVHAIAYFVVIQVNFYFISIFWANVNKRNWAIFYAWAKLVFFCLFLKKLPVVKRGVPLSSHFLTIINIYFNIFPVFRRSVSNDRLAERGDDHGQLVRQRQEGPHLRNLEFAHGSRKYPRELLSRLETICLIL